MLALLPGDALPASSSATSTTLHLGPGLSSDTFLSTHHGSASASALKGKQRAVDAALDSKTPRVAATRAGLLGKVHQGDKDRYWIEGTLKRVSAPRVSLARPFLGSPWRLTGSDSNSTRRNRPSQSSESSLPGMQRGTGSISGRRRPRRWTRWRLKAQRSATSQT